MTPRNIIAPLAAIAIVLGFGLEPEPFTISRFFDMATILTFIIFFWWAT